MELQKAEDCLASLRHFIEAVTLRDLLIRISIFPEDITLTGNGQFFDLEILKFNNAGLQKYAILCNGFWLITNEEIEAETFDINEWIAINIMVLEIYQGNINEFLLKD